MRNKIKFLTIILSLFLIIGTINFPVYAEKLEAIETLDEVVSSEEIEREAKTQPSDDNNSENTINDPVAGQNIESGKKITLPARNIKLKTSQKNKIIIGKTFQIKYSLSPLKSDDTVTYRNFNKKIVRVDENGLVTAIGYGTAKIQLETSSGKKRNIDFTVTDENGNVQTELVKGDATQISFVNQFAMIRKGKTKQLLSELSQKIKEIND